MLCVAPLSVQAQEWVTPEFCDVSDIHLTEAQFADVLASVAETGIDAPVNGHGRFWQITSPEGSVSHLWGTFHSSERRALDLPQAVEYAIENARIIALESDHRARDRADLERVYSYSDWWDDGLLPPTGLALLAGADLRIQGWIEERFAAIGYTPDTLPYFTQGAIANVLLGDPCEDLSLGVLPIQDNFILTLAHVQDIEIVGLESSFAFFDTLNDPENRALASAMITSYGAYLEPLEDRVERAEWLTLYTSGEIGAMMVLDRAFTLEKLGPLGESALALRDGYLLETRNRNWLERIEPELRKGNVFMAVGSFHLPGETGLVALLREAGFQVSRVPVEGET